MRPRVGVGVGAGVGVKNSAQTSNRGFLRAVYGNNCEQQKLFGWFHKRIVYQWNRYGL
jgi:hypothetical protein